MRRCQSAQPMTPRTSRLLTLSTAAMLLTALAAPRSLHAEPPILPCALFTPAQMGEGLRVGVGSLCGRKLCGGAGEGESVVAAAIGLRPWAEWRAFMPQRARHVWGIGLVAKPSQPRDTPGMRDRSRIFSHHRLRREIYHLEPYFF